MNKKILIFLAITLTTQAHAALRGAPYIPEEDQRFSDLEVKTNLSGDASSLSAAGVLAVNPSTVRQMVKATYDFSVNGGSIGDKSLAVSVPALAVITRVTLKVDTAFTASSTANMSFGCAGRGIATLFSANQLATSAVNVVLGGAITSSQSIGVPTGALALGSSTCDIIANIAGGNGPFTAGKASLWVDYLQAP